MASEMAFSQINSGFHSRHAPCGMSIDMSRIFSKKGCKGATAIRSVHRGQQGRSFRVFRHPRKRNAGRRGVLR
jgi:hypothetical protein